MRYVFLTLLTTLTLFCSGCMLDNQALYERAQLYLGAGKYEAAAELFGCLGEYAQAGAYQLYCEALQAMTEGDRALARTNFALIDPFKSSGRYLRYLDALDAGQHDPEAALHIWEELGTFADSAAQAQTLRTKIPQMKRDHARLLMTNGRWAQALTMLESLPGDAQASVMAEECRTALRQEAYDRAEAMYDAGRFEEAMAAFEALGDSLDAKARALQCRSAMYRQLEQDFRTASLATVSDLMDRYAEMEDYLDSAQRLAELQQRFGVNLRMAEGAYVLFGSWPADGSAADVPLTWQVLRVDGSTATLQCTRVLNLAQTAEAFPHLTQAEAAGVISVQLPAQTMLTQTGGVRPVLEVSLDRFAFTGGTGSADDPYR